jgi:adenylate kinase
MNVVLLGPPGSGKGTQGQILSGKFKIKHLSTGDLFRQILEDPNHPLYPQVQVVNEGKLISDEVVNQVVADGLKKPEYREGVIFDGYPRTVAQAEALDNIMKEAGNSITLVIDLNVTREVLIHRLLGRVVCTECKAIYHENQGYVYCTKCGAKLIRRDDDNEAAIVERFEEYTKKTEPLREYYRNSGVSFVSMFIDDAVKSAEDVQGEIIGKLSRLNII